MKEYKMIVTVRSNECDTHTEETIVSSYEEAEQLFTEQHEDVARNENGNLCATECDGESWWSYELAIMENHPNYYELAEKSGKEIVEDSELSVRERLQYIADIFPFDYAYGVSLLGILYERLK